VLRSLIRGVQFTILREPIVTAIRASLRSKNGTERRLHMRSAPITYRIACASGYNIIEIYEDWQEIYAGSTSRRIIHERRFAPRLFHDICATPCYWESYFCTFDRKGSTNKSRQGISVNRSCEIHAVTSKSSYQQEEENWLDLSTEEKLNNCSEDEDVNAKLQVVDALRRSY